MGLHEHPLSVLTAREIDDIDVCAGQRADDVE
jgi:hypothetical protein